MKKLILTLLMIFVLPYNAFTYPNEPDGFRAMKWCESLEQLEKKGYSFVLSHYLPNKSPVYELITTDKNVFGVEAIKIRCNFWNNQLNEVNIIFAEQSTDFRKKFNPLYKYAIENFGESTPELTFIKPDSYFLYWKGEKTKIILYAYEKDELSSKDTAYGDTALVLASEVLSKKIMAEVKAKKKNNKI